ncbi:MAG: hypothetical protein C0447_09625 [Methylobacterium sp.]|nr:hypothetical protein [Methylobacterium sp.]
MLGLTSRRPAPVGAARLSFSRRNTLGWYGGWYNDPAYADLAAIADFNRDRYAIPTTPLGSIAGATASELCVKRECTFAEWFAFTASSTTARSYTDTAGILRNDLAVDQPRFDWLNGKRQLALNGQSTNLIRNITMQGAATGSPGIVPANWFVSIPTGCSRTITNIGTFNGVDIIDIRITGAASGGGLSIRPEGSLTQSPASPAQAWTFSAFAQVLTDVGGSMTDLRMAILALDAGPVQIGADDGPNQIVAAQSWSRLQNEYPATPANTAYVLPLITSGTTSWAGKTVDMVLRVGLPQLEQSPFMSPVIKTTGSAVTRAIESARMSPVIEAILQRSAASVVVRGQNMLRGQGTFIGGGASQALLRSNTSGFLPVIDGSSSLLGGGSAPAWAASTFGTFAAFDAGSRRVGRSGGTDGGDAGTPPSDRGVIYLGRLGTGPTVGDGHYDFVGIAPSRLSNARLRELAVPA